MLRTLAISTIALFGLAISPAAAKAPSYIERAVADSHRPESDTALDPERKPVAMLEFAGIKPGMTVVDFIPGAGYFTRLFSKAVGPTGHVYAFQPSDFDKLYKTGKKPAIYAVADDPAYANVTVIHAPISSFVTPRLVDVVWTSQNYHDLHNVMQPAQVVEFDKRVFASVKPGGEFVVLDHRAKAGTGIADTGTLHRIDPAVVKREVEEAGFKYAGHSKVLENPKDALTLRVFDPKIRHHTDQFIYKFVRPKK